MAQPVDDAAPLRVRGEEHRSSRSVGPGDRRCQRLVAGGVAPHERQGQAGHAVTFVAYHGVNGPHERRGGQAVRRRGLGRHEQEDVVGARGHVGELAAQGGASSDDDDPFAVVHGQLVRPAHPVGEQHRLPLTQRLEVAADERAVAARRTRHGIPQVRQWRLLAVCQIHATGSDRHGGQIGREPDLHVMREGAPAPVVAGVGSAPGSLTRAPRTGQGRSTPCSSSWRSPPAASSSCTLGKRPPADVFTRPPCVGVSAVVRRFSDVRILLRRCRRCGRFAEIRAVRSGCASARSAVPDRTWAGSHRPGQHAVDRPGPEAARKLLVTQVTWLVTVGHGQVTR